MHTRPLCSKVLRVYDVFLTLVGVFELLERTITATHYQRRPTFCAPKRFLRAEIESAYLIRLVSCMKEYRQHAVEYYFKKDSTCPFDMPLGEHNFKIINAHIDGSSKNCHDKEKTDDIER
jgi:hypothetical protein